MKSKGELESEVSQALIRFEKEWMGRGPLETKTYLVDDLVVVRLRGVLTPAEHKLAQADEKNSRELIKQVRQQLIEQGRPLLDAALKGILGVCVKSLHTDISTRSGERIIVFTMDDKPHYRDG